MNASRKPRSSTLAPPGDEDEEDLAMCWPGYKEELERRATRHRNRATLLVFFRDRVLANEIYLLSERDLPRFEWLPADDMTSLRV